MIHINECAECGKTWPCTKVMVKCLKCTEAEGKVYA